MICICIRGLQHSISFYTWLAAASHTPSHLSTDSEVAQCNHVHDMLSVSKVLAVEKRGIECRVVRRRTSP